MIFSRSALAQLLCVLNRLHTFLFSISFHFESNVMKPLLQVKNSLVYNFDFSCLFVCVCRPVDLILIALGCIYSYCCIDRFSMFWSIYLSRKDFFSLLKYTKLKWKTSFDFSFPFQQYLVYYFFLCIVYLSLYLYLKLFFVSSVLLRLSKNRSIIESTNYLLG